MQGVDRESLTSVVKPPPVVGAVFQAEQAALEVALPYGMLIAEVGVLAPSSIDLRVVLVLVESIYSGIGRFGLLEPENFPTVRVECTE